MNKHLLIIISLSLSGCISAYADNQCQSVGYQVGSAAYNSCFQAISQQQQSGMLALSQQMLQPH